MCYLYNMADQYIQYKIAADTSLYSTPVPSLHKVLVAIPGANELKITPTYSNQLLPGYEVLMELCDSRQIAAAMMSDIGVKLQAAAEEQLETQLQLESLEKEVKGLNINNATRARPFLEYASRARL